MRVYFFTVPVLALASSLTVGCGGGSDSPSSASLPNLGLGGLPGVDTSTGGSSPSTAPTGDTTTPPPATTSTGGTSGVTNPFGGAGAGTGPFGTGATTSSSTGGLPGIVTGTGGSSDTGGTSGTGGDTSSSSAGGSTSSGGAGGSTSIGGASGSAGAGTGGDTTMLHGTCCSDGNCLCHGDPPSMPTSMNGPYKTASFPMTTGTVYYPTGVDGPLAAVSICPGFLNTGPEMTSWGPFYASWGIVCVVTNTGALDLPQTRGTELVNAINELKKQNTTSSSPLNGKLVGWYGTSGYSMGGGGTTFASEADPTMKTSVGLAAWGPDGTTDKVPTLFICSDADTVASCTGTNASYAVINAPKMILDIPGESHFNWFSPTDAGFGESGAYALAFQKVFLEKDTRWLPILKTKPATGTTQMSMIQ
ncbi:MAG TPA: hypothetical protein VHC69_16550 [Polyangiaceae bacterium]|nr:hypothetical protein [Polyangiaceae bacterium]